MTTGVRTQDELIGYDTLDPFKLLAVDAGRKTDGNLALAGGMPMDWTRGESCWAVNFGDFVMGHVIEGLGTKNLVVDQLALARRLYDGGKLPASDISGIGVDVVAMIVNDMITLGIPPYGIGMHLAVGDSSWFKDLERAEALVDGFRRGVEMAGATWGYGETPTLAGIVGSDTYELSGSATGILRDPSMLVNPANIQDGDVILGLRSSGVHANGLTMAREICDRVGYVANPFLKSREGFGRRLLEPTEIYVDYLRTCQAAGLRWSYAINVTGHGWRKIMRANQSWTYHITKLPIMSDVVGHFQDLQRAGAVSDRVMYETFNMGIGFIVIVRPEDADQAEELSTHHVTRLGVVEEGPRQVYIEPLDLFFEELGVR